MTDDQEPRKHDYHVTMRRWTDYEGYVSGTTPLRATQLLEQAVLSGAVDVETSAPHPVDGRIVHHAVYTTTDGQRVEVSVIDHLIVDVRAVRATE